MLGQQVNGLEGDHKEMIRNNKNTINDEHD